MTTTTVSTTIARDIKLLDTTLSEVIIYSPTTPGTYPLVQFQHGFAQPASGYSAVLTALATSGYIVVAPQMYRSGWRAFLRGGSPRPETEAAWVRQASAWLTTESSSLPSHLPDGVTADRATYVLIGHSRGSQACWMSQADGAGGDSTAAGVCGVDPVEGYPNWRGKLLPVLFRDAAASVDIRIPSFVLGSFEGGAGWFAAAPPAHNYEVYIDRTRPRPRGVVLPRTGHFDICMDDESVESVQGWVVRVGTRDPGERRANRETVAALLGAFCEEVLRGRSGVLAAEMGRRELLALGGVEGEAQVVAEAPAEVPEREGAPGGLAAGVPERERLPVEVPERERVPA